MGLSLTELQEEAQADLRIDIMNAEKKSLQAPALKEKYARYLLQAKAAMKKSEIDMNQKWREKHRYYTEDHPKRLQKTEIGPYIKGDPDYIKIEARHQSNVLLVEYLEQIMKSIDQISWNLGNAIKLHIFMNGGN